MQYARHCSKKQNIAHKLLYSQTRYILNLNFCKFVNKFCGSEKNCAGAGRVRVQLVRVWVRVQLVRGGAGADTEYKFMCGFSQARGPAGRVRAWFRGPRRPLLHTSRRHMVTIGESTISPASHVRNIGVEIDSHLSMSHQVSAICKSCNFHLYRLSSIRRYLTVEATRNAVLGLITAFLYWQQWHQPRWTSYRRCRTKQFAL